MDDVLIYADTIRSPDLRHAVPVSVPDPLLYLERNGRRVVVTSSMEMPRVREADPGLELYDFGRFGLDELVRSGLATEEVELEVVVRACNELGVASAQVPPSFPLELADHLRANGIEVESDRDLFLDRRRRKNHPELGGIRRAQAAAQEAMARAAGLLRAAEPREGQLVLEGELLTCERVRAAVHEVYTDHGVACEDTIVSHGPQTAIGHEEGSGPIAPNEAVLLDLFPRDRASACWADMTRTFCVGEPPAELREFHTLCREALERALAAIRPGVEGREVFQLVCELFHEHGYPTQLSKEPGQVLEDGFYHSLGHGVGLEVHERPWLGRSAGNVLVAGDVLAVEPGLYRAGFGGCRLEDLVLVTDGGAELLTSYPYDLEP